MDHGGCGCMTWTNTNTQTGFLLSVLIVSVRHIVQLWPTPASPSSTSPDRSTTCWNNETTWSSSFWKECQWHHQRFSKKFRKFKLWSTWGAQSDRTNKVKHSEKKKTAGTAPFLHATACCCSRSLLTVNKRKKKLLLRKKCYVDTCP